MVQKKATREPPATWRHRAEGGLLALAAVLLAACFFEPSVERAQPQADLVVVLDITQSMSVTDELIDGEPASRLAFAKRALHASLLRLPCGSKVGWAIFAEYRALLLLAPVEVCANQSELQAALVQIDARMAWSGNSEIAKGLHSAIGIAAALAEKPALVFVTDGHEAPPLHPRFRPRFDDKPGEVPGLIVGVGEPRLSPIPKTDPQGRPLGFWRADEVAQRDLRSQGRGASVGGEAMVDDPEAPPPAALPGGLGATPGSEHFSSLREPYLRLLASEQGMAFLRLQSQEALDAALLAPALARPAVTRVDLRGWLAAVALALLVAGHVLRWLPAVAGGWRRRKPAT